MTSHPLRPSGSTITGDWLSCTAGILHVMTLKYCTSINMYVLVLHGIYMSFLAKHSSHVIGARFSTLRDSKQPFLFLVESEVRAFVWHLSKTSAHWGFQLYSFLTMLQANMCFPFAAKKHIIQPATIQPLPQQWAHSLVFTHFQSEEGWAFDHEHDEMWSNLIYCWLNDSQRHPSAALTLN